MFPLCNMDESIHVSDLKVDDDVEIHEDPESVVASVVFVKEPELEPTPEDEVTEPELVGDEETAKNRAQSRPKTMSKILVFRNSRFQDQGLGLLKN